MIAERSQTQYGAHSSLNLPNAISALRFPLGLAFPLVDGIVARAAIVLIAAATDWIDGRLARRNDHVTRLGEVLDPIADKTFMLLVLGTLVAEGRIPLWALLLLLVRDIGVAVGAIVMAARGWSVRMPARMPGKVVTWLQFLAIGLILLWPSTALWVSLPVAVAGVIALVDYARAAAALTRRGAHT